MSTHACPFCRPNWPNLNVVERPDSNPETLIINPLNPVTEGHVLVICAAHTVDAAADASVAQHLMYSAARYVSRHRLQANIITSIGPDATQTVFHTHIHVVPRHPGDGLALPWTEKCGDRMEGILGEIHHCEKPLGHRGEHCRGNVTWHEVLG